MVVFYFRFVCVCIYNNNYTKKNSIYVFLFMSIMMLTAYHPCKSIYGKMRDGLFKLYHMPRTCSRQRASDIEHEAAAKIAWAPRRSSMPQLPDTILCHHFLPSFLHHNLLFCTVCPSKCLAVSGSLNVKIFSCIYMYIYIYT